MTGQWDKFTTPNTSREEFDAIWPALLLEERLDVLDIANEDIRGFIYVEMSPSSFYLFCPRTFQMS